MNHDCHQIATTLATRYQKNPRRSGKEWMTNCPLHDDSTGSLSVTADSDKLLVKCQAGCDQDNVFKEVLKLCGLTSNANGQHQEIVYQYKDHTGKTILEKVRRHLAGGKKTFYIRQPDDNGGYVKKNNKHTMDGADASILYRLPEVLLCIQNNEPIWIAEGEKDCDNLAKIGLVATCNIFGASQDGKAPKWTDKHTKWLEGLSGAVILPDNDDAGRAHALAEAKSLTRAGIKCKILELPGLPDKGDVSDWLAAGGTKEQLLDLAANAEIWTDISNTGTAGNNEPEYTLDEVKAALDSFKRNSITGVDWLNVGVALKNAGLDLELWKSWLKRIDPDYSPTDCDKRWTGELENYTADITTLWKLAAAHGYTKAGYIPNADNWPDPEPITDELLPVPSLLPEMLPEPYRAYIIDVSERMSCPPEFVAAALLTITGSLIGTACGIKPKCFDDWLEVPNIWGAVVATPSQLKSPAIEAPGKCLSEIEQSANESNELAMQKHLAETEAYKAQKEVLTSQMKSIARNTLV